MEELKLELYGCYRAKRPGNSNGFVNDRQIRWIGADGVQYDSPAIRFGGKYPTVSKEAFLKWAGRRLGDTELPDGDWAAWDFQNRKNNK